MDRQADQGIGDTAGGNTPTVTQVRRGYRYTHILPDGFVASYTSRSVRKVRQYAAHNHLSIVKG